MDNFKDVFKVADTLNNPDLYKKLTELQTRVMEIEEENLSLKEQLGQLNQHLSTPQSLQHDGGLYWIQKAGEAERPYRQVCWDVDLSARGAIKLMVSPTVFVITAIDMASGDLEKIKFGNGWWYADVGVVAC